MKQITKYLASSLLILLVITSCSRKKNSFVNRAWHSVGTEYNILYNGNIAFEQGRKSLNDSYFDNYWDILPIERMQVFEEVTLPGQSKNENFTRAEEKAVKAIQKHSMNIAGKEHNPQIDEAYLLLGKSRYFDQRFIPALEAFNYILYKYPASDKINQAKIWREKTNIRLENDDLAIKNLKRLLEQEKLSKQDLADATAMLAQAYINTKSIDSAAWQLEIAAENTKSNDERGRYRFIQGQLYNTLGHKDSANFAFEKVIDLKRRTPRIYHIAAHLEKAKNFNYNDGDKLGFLELLTDLEENRENRPYLDKIYYQIADYYKYTNNDSLATVYYNKSLRTSSQDKLLKAKDYEALAIINFDNAQYKEAGDYYDSTMTNLVKDSKPFRLIKKKRDNLQDVITYEGKARRCDSILNLVTLSDTDKREYFEAYIAKLKAEEEAKREQAERDEMNKGFATVNNDIQDRRNRLSGPGGPSPDDKSAFYFYNPTTVAYGKNEFRRNWGDRKLEDNWRWSNKKNIGELITENEVATLEDEISGDKYNVDTYLAKLPKTQQAVDSIAKERNYAYYQLGLLYKEKFKEYELSKHKFEQLLNNKPEQKLILPSKYNLYKLYQLLGENGEAEIAKNEIINSYPDSRYAAILKNPEIAATKDDSSPVSVYEKLYQKFQKQQYSQVITEAENNIKVFEGDPIVPKFELLKAIATGRSQGYDAYSEAVNFVAVNYANTPEGKQAKDLADNTLPRLKDKTFKPDAESKKFKAVFEFKNASETELANFVKDLDKVLSNATAFRAFTSVDYYNNDTTFVVVHGFSNSATAKGFTDLLEYQDRATIRRPYFGISSDNYQIIQIHKNLQDYLSL